MHDNARPLAGEGAHNGLGTAFNPVDRRPHTPQRCRNALFNFALNTCAVRVCDSARGGGARAIQMRSAGLGAFARHSGVPMIVLPETPVMNTMLR